MKILTQALRVLFLVLGPLLAVVLAFTAFNKQSIHHAAQATLAIYATYYINNALRAAAIAESATGASNEPERKKQRKAVLMLAVAVGAVVLLGLWLSLSGINSR